VSGISPRYNTSASVSGEGVGIQGVTLLPAGTKVTMR
jgi:hypothetical protein